MAVSNADRCPRCGSMYTGGLLPGEDPENRYCYTCEMQAGSQEMAERLDYEAAHPNAEDDLALQVDPNVVGKPRKGRMAPGIRPTNRRPVSNRVAPQGRAGMTPSRTAMAAVQQPAIQAGEEIEIEVDTEMDPEIAPSPRRQGSSVNIPPAKRQDSSVIMPAVQRGSRVNMPAVPSTSRPAMPAVRGTNAAMPAVEAQSRMNMPAVQPGSRTNIPAVNRGGSNVNMPAVQPGSRTNIPAVQRGGSNPNIPAVQPGSRTNIPAVQRGGSNSNIPAIQPGSRTNIPAVQRGGSATGIPAARRGSSVTMPAVQAGRSSVRNKAVAPDNTKKYAMIGGGAVVGLVILVLLFKGGSKPKPSDEAVAAAPAATETKPNQPKLMSIEEAMRANGINPNQTPPQNAEAPKPETQKVEAPPAETAKTTPAKEAEKIAEKAPTAPAATETPAKEEQVAAAEKKTEAEKTDVNDLLQVDKPRKASNAKLGDDEEALPADRGPARAAAPAGNDPKKAKADENKPDAMVGLGLKKQPEPEKPLPPGAKPAVVEATAKEPTIIPIDLNKGDQTNEVQFSKSLNNMPGWRVRDINVTNSIASQSVHRGRNNVIALNPLNDVVPAKLYATIEVPANFAGKRPVLLYELSSKDAVHEWFITVRVANVELVKKQVIKTKEPEWIDSGVDLTPLAGKRFELQIEATIPKIKDTKKYKEYVAYFRNVRLDWSGKGK